jgi:hypothetical protein
VDHVDFSVTIIIQFNCLICSSIFQFLFGKKKRLNRVYYKNIVLEISIDHSGHYVIGIQKGHKIEYDVLYPVEFSHVAFRW